ncbi:MAG: FAD/NAD(P)-binding protein [Luteimonas sp.]
MTHSVPASVDVLVVGGGACGALVALHLLRAGGLRVGLVDPGPRPARGVAYSTPRGEHLLNVPAARMSAFDDVPDDFVAFLRGHPDMAQYAHDALPTLFAPRRLYGEYLQARLDAAPSRETLALMTDRVVDVLRDGDGYTAELGSGTRLQARAVVLASGNPPGALPCDRDGEGVAIEAWDYAAVADIAEDADVCIVGAGLSMVDVLVTLQAKGHRGRVLAISRTGLKPLAHAPGTVPQAGGVEAMLPLGVRARMRLLRQWAGDATAQGRPWQDALERLRPQVRALWQSWPVAEQRRFLRHAVRLWDIHRHRIAPAVAAIVDDMAADGRFELRAGRLHRIARHDTRLQVGWTPRDAAATTTTVDVVVNATGMEKRLPRMPGPLLPALYARGLVAPGPLGLGLATGGEGELLDARGQPWPRLWTLGANRIGDLWETIAMPELRGQAARVAAAAAESLAPRDA